MFFKFSNFILGTFLLLAAAFIIFNQFDNFMDLGIGSIIITILALIFIVQCIANSHYALLPIPIAVLYIIFQTPFNLPNIQTKYLIIASIFASIGLGIMIPGRSRKIHHKFKKCDDQNYSSQQMHTENTSPNNNQSISVKFGSISRRLCADSLETVKLCCKFGAMEIFFDQAVLSSNGAVVDIDCSFGAIELFIPKTWKVIDQVNCSLGGVDIDRYFVVNDENAPVLTLNGNVSFGGIELRSI